MSAGQRSKSIKKSAAATQFIRDESFIGGFMSPCSLLLALAAVVLILGEHPVKICCKAQ